MASERTAAQGAGKAQGEGPGMSAGAAAGAATGTVPDAVARRGAGPISPARTPRPAVAEAAPWWEAALRDGPAPDTATPHTAPLPPRLGVAGFGQRLELQAPPWPFLREDTLWRLRHVYEPALAAAVLPATGLAVDIGAGFGGFALPFARAFPGWSVWCFEPEPEAQAALAANIAALGLENVIALPLAVGGTPGPGADPDEALDLGALAGVLAGLAAVAAGAEPEPQAEADDLAALLALCPQRSYRQHPQKPGVLEAGAGGGLRLPTLPAAALAVLAPGLVKLTAPQAEAAILEDLETLPLDHLIGEMWAQVPSALVHGRSPGQRQCWLPLAGRPGLALRRGPGMPEAVGADLAAPALRRGAGGVVLDSAGRRHGLDVVVAMYNAAAWIGDCLEGVLSSPSEEIRALVVDDGSTDGSAELVRDVWGSDPRLTLVSKPNGGCASARNYGRLMSDASHIAFVDADDIPGPLMFHELLELARYSGAELVQGGFDLVHPEPGGGLRSEPCYEDAALAALETEPFGFGLCKRVPAGLLMTGQPSIWRRVARRDFLDNRNIWFPEHIRAFDDQIFQLLSLQHAGEVPMVEHVRYGYRQHPGQDIRQGDERAFASLEMFRMVLRRAVEEGWPDLAPLGASLVNTLNWSGAEMRPELRPRFVRAAAELWVLSEQALAGSGLGPRPGAEGASASPEAGPEGLGALGQPEAAVTLPDFAHHTAALRRRLAGLPPSRAWGLLDSVEFHAPLVRSLPPG